MAEVYLTVQVREYHYYNIEVDDDFDVNDFAQVERLLDDGDNRPVETDVRDETIERVEYRASDDDDWKVVT